MDIAKVIFYGVVGIFAICLIMPLLPYVVMFLAFAGAYYIWQEIKPKR